jgi:hypothetical protein
MVICTEYRGQRYAMGSSDPLPAGIEIRFGSLNFQATGNDYLMRLTNREELHVRCQAGSVPVAAARVAATPTPASTDAAGPSVPRCHGATDALAYAHDRRGRSTDMSRASLRNAMRPPARRQPHWQESARSQDRASLSACAAPRRRTSPLSTPTQQCAGHALASTSRTLGIPAPPPAMIHPKALPTSCHLPLCTVRKVGFLRCTRPSDVPAVP